MSSKNDDKPCTNLLDFCERQNKLYYMEPNTLISKEEYLNFLSEQMKSVDHFTFIKDTNIINKAKAFCSMPVISYNGIARAAETFRFKTLSEMQNFVNDKEFILYTMGIYVKTGDINDATFSIDYYDQAEVVYTLRAVVL